MRLFDAAWNKQLERDTLHARLLPSRNGLGAPDRFISFDLSHPFHRMTGRTHLPPDDIARLLRISPGGLLKIGLDRDLTMKRLRPSLRDQTDDLIVDGDDPLLVKPGAH